MSRSYFDSQIHYLVLIMVDRCRLCLSHEINLGTIDLHRPVCQFNKIIFHTHSSCYSSIFHRSTRHLDSKIYHSHYVGYWAYIRCIYLHSHILIQHNLLLLFHEDLKSIRLIIHLTIQELWGCYLTAVTGVGHWVVCWELWGFIALFIPIPFFCWITCWDLDFI